MADPIVYFPEPTTPDETIGRCRESTFEWLARSSHPRAAALREYLNRSLNHFPHKVAKSLAKRLQYDWRAHLFEVQVGRYLQVLGADPLMYEAVGTNGKRVDFLATFPDGAVSIECVTKRYNEGPRLERENKQCLASLIESVSPIGWLIAIDHLPKVTPGNFEPWLAVAREWMDALPKPVEDGAEHEFLHGDRWEGERLELTAKPMPRLTKPATMGPATAYFDDSAEVLRDALIDVNKRQQARGAVKPVLLAIDAPFDGPHAEDFDVKVFGHTVGHIGTDHREYAVTFVSDGVFVTDRDVVFDGVLAFLRLEYSNGLDPILYVNPYSPHRLPDAITRHETRRWKAGVEVEPAKREPVMHHTGMLKVPDDE